VDRIGPSNNIAYVPLTSLPLALAVIVGHGRTGIGMHIDVDNFTGTRVPVSTYLSMQAGRKRVVLMPPGQTLYPLDSK
jgi:hypothetical protein